MWLTLTLIIKHNNILQGKMIMKIQLVIKQSINHIDKLL